MLILIISQLYVLVVTLSARKSNLSKRLTKGFQRFVWWKRYKTKSETRDKRLKVIPEYLLDYEYIKNYYKLIVVDLSKQK